MTPKTRVSAKTPEPRRISLLWLVLIAVLALGAAVFHRHNPLSQQAQGYAATVSAASAATYVTLRMLNAALSTAQEVEVGASLGFSGTVQPGKMLEPVDDTIERIAGVVFALMLVTGVLAVAMGPVGAVGAAMIAGASALWIADRLLGPRDVISMLSRRLVWYGLFFLLALPGAFVLTDLLANRFTGDVMMRHQAIIAEITDTVEVDPALARDQGWWDRLTEGMSEVDRYRELASNIWSRADELIASYLALLSVYIFQIFVLPALLVGAFFILARFFASRA
ncbi:hypothetical protein AB9K34_12565 [Sedimentitalea sp. XS_ASV28]|uniref:hypothetical protein n=1 Tax=Sedimentitalea sp. XS_ASV28 TaxID=3241296 RepID=UPI003518A941